MNLESGHFLAASSVAASQSLTGSTECVSWDCSSMWAPVGKDYLPSSLAVDRTQHGGWPLVSFPCHMGPSDIAACPIKASSKESNTESLLVTWKSQILKIITQVASHQMGHILSAKCKSLSPAYPPGKYASYSYKYQESGKHAQHCPSS